jgi:hypothetical protein
MLFEPLLGSIITVFNITNNLPHTSFDFFSVPFFVPVGTQEIQIEHHSINDPQRLNILDFGLMDPNQQFRGWGGGNAEDIVVGEVATSRSYLTGRLQTEANWSVVIGKAQLGAFPGGYELIITLRDAPTLPPQTERYANSVDFYASCL